MSDESNRGSIRDADAPSDETNIPTEELGTSVTNELEEVLLSELKTQLQEETQALPTEANFISEDSDDDDYLESDENDLEELLNTERLGYGSSILDHSAYFAESISQALDSLLLDKSLVVQAQLSGQLNNENQRLKEKRLQVLEKAEGLRKLYRKHFEAYIDPVTDARTTRTRQLQKDLLDIERRLASLKEGLQHQKLLGSLFSGTKKLAGVAKRYPIEYNQARDKILERQIEE